MHKRLKPLNTKFQGYTFHHRLFWFLLNLQQLETSPQQTLQPTKGLLTLNRWNLYSFYPKDHLNIPTLQHLPLTQRVLTYLNQHNPTQPYPPNATILLLTSVRVLGYGFNPVSFFFVAQANGTQPIVLVEVSNTFGEQKLYIVPPHPTQPNTFELKQTKAFYVSPFGQLQQAFLFRLRWPTQHLALGIHTLGASCEEEEEIDSQPTQELHTPWLVSSVGGQHHPLTASTLLNFSLKVPFLSLKVISLIHWHAFKLWLKQVPFFTKEANPQWQQQVLRPHKSLRPTP